MPNVFIGIRNAPDTNNLLLKVGWIEKRYNGKLDKNSKVPKAGWGRLALGQRNIKEGWSPSQDCFQTDQQPLDHVRGGAEVGTFQCSDDKIEARHGCE